MAADASPNVGWPVTATLFRPLGGDVGGCPCARGAALGLSRAVPSGRRTPASPPTSGRPGYLWLEKGATPKRASERFSGELLARASGWYYEEAETSQDT